MSHPSALRTAEQLEPGDIIRIDGRVERIVRLRKVRGRWMVRTNVNLYRLRARDRVEVVATFVPGIGWVQPLELELAR